ncbi:MAG: Crp/Fnr family transcriptional regulator [Bacteroidota bacterium]
MLDRLANRSDSLVDFIHNRVPLSDADKSMVYQLCKVETFPRGHRLIQQDRTANRIYFIQQGSARAYYIHEGKDVTSWIYPEGQLITSWTSFYTRTPSYENVELTEDAQVMSLTYEELQKLYQQSPKMQEFGRVIVEDQLVFIDYFYKGFMFMSAKEKYDLLLSIFPDVTQRVNLGHIATFLGITQGTLSRIRNQK